MCEAKDKRDCLEHALNRHQRALRESAFLALAWAVFAGLACKLAIFLYAMGHPLVELVVLFLVTLTGPAVVGFLLAKSEIAKWRRSRREIARIKAELLKVREPISQR